MCVVGHPLPPGLPTLQWKVYSHDGDWPCYPSSQPSGAFPVVQQLGALTLNTSMQLGGSWAGVGMLLIGLLPFVAATWEEFVFPFMHAAIL